MDEVKIGKDGLICRYCEKNGFRSRFSLGQHVRFHHPRAKKKGGKKKPRPSYRAKHRSVKKHLPVNAQPQIKFCGFCGHRILNAVGEEVQHG